MNKTVAAIGVAATLALGSGAARAIDVTVDPRMTFLLTQDDPSARNALVLSLAELGFAAGDSIDLASVGNFRAGTAFADTNTRLIGVFSSSNVLLASTERNRVAGALDAGSDFATAATFIGGIATDIAQDFTFTNGTIATVTIPVGASFLFVGVSDTFFGDNTDPNSNFAVRVAATPGVPAIPEPGTVLLLVAGLATIAAARQRALRAAAA